MHFLILQIAHLFVTDAATPISYKWCHIVSSSTGGTYSLLLLSICYDLCYILSVSSAATSYQFLLLSYPFRYFCWKHILCYYCWYFVSVVTAVSQTICCYHYHNLFLPHPIWFHNSHISTVTPFATSSLFYYCHILSITIAGIQSQLILIAQYLCYYCCYILSVNTATTSFMLHPIYNKCWNILSVAAVGNILLMPGCCGIVCCSGDFFLLYYSPLTVSSVYVLVVIVLLLST
jgi:hypothetical protein